MLLSKWVFASTSVRDDAAVTADMSHTMRGDIDEPPLTSDGRVLHDIAAQANQCNAHSTIDATISSELSSNHCMYHISEQTQALYTHVRPGPPLSGRKSERQSDKAHCGLRIRSMTLANNTGSGIKLLYTPSMWHIVVDSPTHTRL